LEEGWIWLDFFTVRIKKGKNHFMDVEYYMIKQEQEKAYRPSVA